MSYAILTNQIGYDVAGPKRAVIRSSDEKSLERFELRQGERTVLVGSVAYVGRVDRWRDWHFSLIDFSVCVTPGTYDLHVFGDSERLAQTEIRIEPQCWLRSTAHDVLDYFKSQHCSGKYEEADYSIPFVGERADRVDVHGGWFDASGDMSKYLSHLSYANFMNPQQTPLVVWAMLEANERLADAGDRDDLLSTKLRAEATHGADFLVRMQDPAGYFYMTVFDKWSKDTSQREICAYKTQQGIKLESYQAGYRQGGGVAIAALARAAHADLSGEFAGDRYRQAAEAGFNHLETHNGEYLDDGRENIIDDYCALLAATELFRLTRHERYQGAARRRARSLLERLTTSGPYQGFLRADAEGQRPFFHAVEAGLPVTALLTWYGLEVDATFQRVIEAGARAALEFELSITSEVANPFGYPRQYVKPVGSPPHTSFFIPHDNETGYWWQGENARLGSVATAAGSYLRLLGAHDGDAPFHERLRRYAHAPIDWIHGLNPFDSCMIFGQGRNNLDYEPLWPNAPGGICNGVTSGFNDERDIEFGIPGIGGEHSWRWGEQWIPHAAWYLLAIATLGHPNCRWSSPSAEDVDAAPRSF